jgi:hypothetical protein
MNNTFQCGDHEALVAYLYDECEAADREAIASHVSRCPSCAEEVEALHSTRSVLAAWTPPASALGFQITRAVERAEPTVLRPAAWWRRPLPAWAQAAAAALIFAAGMTLGGARTGPATAAIATGPPAAAPAATARVADTANSFVGTSPSISRADLARLEQRLRAVETSSQVRSAAARPAPVTVDEDALMQRVQALIETSETRQRSENLTLVANLARYFDDQRRVDQRQVDEKLGRMYGSTGEELRQYSEAINSLVRAASFQPASGR